MSDLKNKYKDEIKTTNMRSFPLSLNASTAKFSVREESFTNNYRKLAFAALFAACLIFSASSSTVHAATFVVNSTVDAIDITAGNGVCETAAGNGVCTLRAAITEANALAGADIITLPAGTYTTTIAPTGENLNANGDFDITSDITINGAGAGSTFIQAAAGAGTATERVMHFVTAGTSTVNGVTIRYGRYTVNTFGSGVRVETSGVNATFNNVVISDNTDAGRGGGIYLVTAGATLTMNNSTVTNNTSGVLTTSSSVGGAGIYLLAGTATLNNTTVSNNQSINNATAAVSSFGGGVTVAGGILNLNNNSTVTGNTATTSTANSAFGGGIAMSGGTVNLTDSFVTNNTTSSTGTGAASVGGIDNEQATLNLTRTTVSGNTAGSSGGIRSLASTIAATTTITQSAIVNNSTPNIGGIFNITVGTAAATTTINNSTVGGNSSNFDGGGVETYTTAAGNAVVNINYSTIAANTADADGNATGNGGGVANFGQQTAGQTGTSTVNLQSSIIADNVSVGGTGPDIFGVITSLGYNHVENTAGGTFPIANGGGNAPLAAGDVTGVDPRLTALALNGGTTLNYQPSPRSPVLDTIPTGTNGCGTAPFNIDQRGLARPTDSNNDTVPACEKGAVETLFATAAAVSINGKVLSNGRGLANARVELTGTGGKTRAVVTNAFGNFTIFDVEAGATYIVNVSAKRYTFAPQVISVTDSISGLTLTAQ